jgi:pyridoxine kinase
MPRILAISSQVAYGHVGLSAIVPAVQALGDDVMAFPTVILSNHPGHPHVAGTRIAPPTLDAMLDALDQNGWLADIDTLLSGYLPSPEHVEFACRAVSRTRARSPGATIICDPILGDEAEGIYIDAAAAAAIRDRLVPLADILLPNRFELAWLTGTEPTGLPEIISAARRLPCPRVLVTSAGRAAESAMLANVLVTGESASYIESPHLADVPKGTGDFLSGVFASDPDLGRAIARVEALVSASVGRPHLAIAQARKLWLQAAPRHVGTISP